MIKLIKIPNSLKNFFIETGELSLFAGRFFKEVFTRPFEFKELLRQMYNMGNRSLLLVSVTGFILGLVFTLQSRPTLMEFGAVSWMPSMVSISIVREIGPVIIALICAGRISSGIGAELGSMRVTEQIDGDIVLNQELKVTKVFEELKQTGPQGIRYASFKQDDGVSFVHIASVETESGNNPLTETTAFKEFQAEIKDRCEEPPVAVPLNEIGSYRFFGD